MLVGAIRWIERRPAINDHARAHLGWLLAALALALAWGYLLEPYELVAGPAELLDRSELAGEPAGLAGAGRRRAGRRRYSPRSGQRGRATPWSVSGWIVLAVASMVGHWLLPSILSGSSETRRRHANAGRLGQLAYGLEGLRDTELERIGPQPRPRCHRSGTPAALAQAFPGDSSHLLSVNPALLTPEARRRPVWLVVRSGRRSGPGSAVADHRVSADR